MVARLPKGRPIFMRRSAALQNERGRMLIVLYVICKLQSLAVCKRHCTLTHSETTSLQASGSDEHNELERHMMVSGSARALANTRMHTHTSATNTEREGPTGRREADRR